MSNILICTVGLPRSGKTTWARKQGLPIVNPDAIRLATHGQRFWAPAERRVWADAYHMVRCLFLAGHTTVIVDATHMTRKRRDFWIADAGNPGGVSWSVAFRRFDVAASVCRERAHGDAKLIEVIDRMDNQQEPLGFDEKELGATGEYPEAPINEDDEGELSFAVGRDSGNVVLRFGKPIAWIGMPPPQAIMLARALVKHAGPTP